MILALATTHSPLLVDSSHRRAIAPISTPDRLLLGPGPSNADPTVLKALSRTPIGHLDPLYVDLMGEVQELLRYAWQTDNRLTLPMSGTGSAAMEATLAGVPAIALSQQGGRENREEYLIADAHGVALVQHLWNNGWTDRIVPNVNFPKGDPEKIKGMMVSTTDQHKFGDIIDDGAKAGHYRLGPLISKPDATPGSDRAAIRDGWIAMTPLGMDLTAHQQLSKFEPLNF